MISTGYQNGKTGHCLRELVNSTRPATLESELRAMALIVAPWAVFAFIMGIWG